MRLSDQFELKVELEATFSNHGEPLSSSIVAPDLSDNTPSTANWPEPPLPSGNLQSPISSPQSAVSHRALFIVTCSLLIILGWRLRRKPWLYGVVSVFVIFSMVTTPVLQAMGIARQAAVREARAAALDEILHTDPLAGARPGWLHDPHSGPPFDLALRQAQGVAQGRPADPFEAAAAAVDSDGDGLNDELEVLLGTADDEEDTDHDGLTDKYEADGFVYNSETWYLNPLSPDTNGDGLSDLAEMIYPDEDSPNLDVDSDGIPNVWDDDNDGDGVPDSIDGSPFSRTGTYSRSNPFPFELERYDTDPSSPLYLTVQLRTTNPDHMRYHQAAFDWPGDSTGNITDKDDTFPRDRRDLMLVPMLELTMANENNLPLEDDPELGHYAMSVIASRNKVLIPLQQMTDGGAVVGLSAKLFFPATTPSWQTADSNGRRAIEGDARVVWVVTAEDDDTGDRSVVAQYYDDFVVTGAVVDEQHGFDIALVYENSGQNVTPDGDGRYHKDPTPLIKALFGLQTGFLLGKDPAMSALESTLNDTWSITPTLSVNRQQFSHVDAGVATTAMTTTGQILDSYPVTMTASPGVDVGILYAFERTVASYNLDHVTGGSLTFGSGRLSLNLTQSKGPVTERGLKLDWFNTYTQESISGQRLADVINNVFGSEWQTAEDQQAQRDIKVLLAGWRYGQTIVVQIDATPIPYDGSLEPGEVENDLEFTQEGWGFISDIAGEFERDEDTGKLQYSKAKLAFKISFNIIKAAAQATGYNEKKVAPGGCVGSLCWDSITVDVVLETIELAWGVYEAVQDIREVKKLFGPAEMSKAEVALNTVALVIDLAVIWTTFFIVTADMDPSSPQYAFMLAYSIALSVIAIVLFVLSFTGIGTIIVILFEIVEAIASLFGVDLRHEIAMWIAGLLVHVDQLTEIPEEGVQFGAVDMQLGDSDVGIIVGNELKYTIPVTSVIQNLEAGGKGDVKDSYYKVKLVTSLGYTVLFADVWSTSPEPQCTWSEESCGMSCTTHKKQCVQYPKLYVNFRQPLPNAPIELSYESRTRLFYQICKCGSCERKTLESTGGNVLDTVYYDVLPARLGDSDDDWDDDDTSTHGLLNWHKSNLWGHNHTFNHDPDGDGLEDETWTDPNKWDSDDDGLSDLYEREARARTSFAFDPLNGDTDNDTLNDKQEKFYGTDPARIDSDGDGLRDDQEVVRATDSGLVGGWEMTLTGGGQSITTWAFPNPTQPDADNDGLTDLDEYIMRSNPNGFTVSIVIKKWAEPILRSDWPPVVRAGQSVTYSLEYFYDEAPLPTTNLVFTDDIPSPLTVTQFDEYPVGLQLTNVSSVDPLVWSSSDVTGTNGFTITIITQVPGGYTDSHWVSNTVRSTAIYASEPISGLSSVPVVIDNDYPSSQVRVPTSGSFINGEGYVFVGDASDPTSWVELMEMRAHRNSPAYDSGWQEATGTAAWAYTWDIPDDQPSDDGTYTVQSRATDPVDHVETPGAGITVTVDNNAPQSTITNLGDGNAISMTILYRTYVPEGVSEPITVTDPYAAVYTVTGTSDDTWTMTDPHNVDRVSGVKRSAFSYDGGEWFSPVTTSTTGLSTIWSHVWRLSFQNFEGVYWLHTRASDQIGNVETPGEGITVTVDNTPPVAALFDTLADTAGERWTISATTIITGTAVDPAYMMHEGGSPGLDYNAARVRIGVAGVDRVQIRASRWLTDTPIVVQDWTDAVVTPTVSGGMTATYGTTWTPTADGVHLVEVRGVDSAGNVGTITTTNDYYLYAHADALGLDNGLYVVDVTSPTTVITSPASGSYANDAVLYVKGTVDDGSYGVGLGHVQVSTDTGQTWITLPQGLVKQTDDGQYTWSYAWDTPATSAVYTISARAVDEIGWVGAADVITVSVDTTAPIAQISDPLHSAVVSGTISGTQRIYMLQGAAKCAVGNVVTQVQVFEDGNPEGSATLLGGPANPVGWVYTWTLPADGAHQLYAMATDDAMPPHVQTETLPITVTVDKAAPVIGLSLGDWNGIITSRTSHVISGTATETNGSGVAAVRVQTDTGQTWQPAAVVSETMYYTWQYTWTLAREDWVTHTVTVRAFDQAGNYTDTLFTPNAVLTPSIIVDNIAPRNPMTLTEITGLVESYWYTDTTNAPQPTITWTVGYDGGGIAGYDIRWYEWEQWERKDASMHQAQIPAAIPDNTEAIFRLRTVDNAGNVAPETFLGPFRLDSEKTASVSIVDGVVETDINEWVPGEMMGLDSRPTFGDVVHYATWGEAYHYPPLGGAFLFLAFDGGSWNGDGDLFIYFDTDPGVSSTGSATTWDYGGYGTHNLPPQDPMTTQEAFKANYVYYIEDGLTGGLMMYTNTNWITATTATTTTFAHYGDQTEIQILWSDLGLSLNDNFQMLAFVQEEKTSTVLAAFPTTNDLSGSLTARYDLNLGTEVIPNANQPQAYSLALDGDAWPRGAVGPGVPATYTLQYQNAGSVDIQDVVRISVTIPSNLSATCADISGDYNTSLGIADQGGGVCVVPVSEEGGYGSLYHLPAGGSGTLTLTGQVGAAAPTGPITVTGYIFGDLQPDIDDSDNWAYPSVLVDATPPDAEFVEEALMGASASGLQVARVRAQAQTVYIGPNATVLGLADDNRSGVTRVEVDLDDGQGWRDASGTTVWSSLISGLSDGDTRTLRLRATDAAGNVSSVKTLDVTVDGLPPQSTISNPANSTTVAPGETIVISGTASDARSGVSKVEVSTDGGDSWSPAAYSDGVWTRNWQPKEGVYTITVRATDAVGNRETPSEQVIVYITAGGDTAGPQIGTPSFDSVITSTQSLRVTVAINDALAGGHGVTAARLYYGYTAPYNAFQVTGTGPGGNGDGAWRFVVPPQGESHVDDTLYFFITAEDGDETPATTTNDNEGGYFQVQIVASESNIYLPLVMRNH